jgi:hypothetical protein
MTALKRNQMVMIGEKRVPMKRVPKRWMMKRSTMMASAMPTIAPRGMLGTGMRRPSHADTTVQAPGKL